MPISRPVDNITLTGERNTWPLKYSLSIMFKVSMQQSKDLKDLILLKFLQDLERVFRNFQIKFMIGMQLGTDDSEIS